MLGILGAVAPMVKVLFKTIDKTIDNSLISKQVKNYIYEHNLYDHDPNDSTYIYWQNN